MAVLKTVLNIALDTVASPSVMLRLKDFVLLVCSALGKLSLIFSSRLPSVQLSISPALPLSVCALNCLPYMTDLGHVD